MTLLDGAPRLEGFLQLLDQLPEDPGDRNEAQREDQRSHIGYAEQIDHGGASRSQKKHIAPDSR